MEFIRKVIYQKASGAVLLAYMMRGGAIIEPTLEQDVANCAELQPYSECMDELGVIGYQEPDQAIEAAFNVCIGYSVDVSEEPHRLVFTYPPEGEVVI